MDQIDQKIVKTGVEKSIQMAIGFLNKLAGPAAEEVGLLLQDRVKFYRLKNQLKILKKAKRLLDEAQVEPKEIPLRTLIPLLDGASLENNGMLSSKWSGLIANAANGIKIGGCHPSFPKILSELSPQDARVLDFLYSTGKEPEWPQFKKIISKKLKVSEDDIELSYNNLFRLILVVTSRKKKDNTNRIRITPFGHMFIDACTAPGEKKHKIDKKLLHDRINNFYE